MIKVSFDTFINPGWHFRVSASEQKRLLMPRQLSQSQSRRNHALNGHRRPASTLRHHGGGDLV